MKFTTITTITTLLMICGSSAWAQDTAPAIPPASSKTKTVVAGSDKASGTVQAQIEAATKAYDQESNAFTKKLYAERDINKQHKMIESRPNPSKTVKLILNFAKDDPKAEGIEKGLVWCLKNANPDQKKEISTLLLTHYKDSKAMSTLAYSYSRMRGGGEDGLRQIIKEAGDENARQIATYYLASKLVQKQASKADGIAMMKTLQKWPGIAESNPKLLARVKGEIFVIENISIGSSAPDIIGTDQEGKEFKLSDYKGQVVLLDFWGIW